MTVANLCVYKSKRRYNPRHIQEEKMLIYTLIFEKMFSAKLKYLLSQCKSVSGTGIKNFLCLLPIPPLIVDHIFAKTSISNSF